MTTYPEKWALIPSDPAVFQDMIQQYGIEEARVEEIFALDLLDENKDNTDVHGLIFISGYVEEPLPDNFDQPDPLASDIVFTAQIVTNVCATLALLAVLLNANINKGALLNSFLEYTKDFSSIDRGMCLGNCQEIRSIHDAYASNAHHVAEDAMDISTEDGNANYEMVDTENYHYISYIYKNGFVWELDGLKYQPLRLKQCTQEDWIAQVKPIIQERMQDRMDVSLLAITRDDYHAKLTQKNLCVDYLQFSRNVIRRNLAKRTLSNYKKKFSNLQYRGKMEYIWNSIRCQEYIIAETNIEAFALEIDPFSRQVDQLTAERQRARANSTRQKFDYFPFLHAFFKAGFQNKLLHDTSKASTKDKETKIPARSTSTPMKRKPASKKTARKDS
ncbi:ubiquitin carboxyl-terminal hydrolase [Mucor lusitanicus]